MKNQTLLILAVFGAGAWWIWDRDKKAKAEAAAEIAAQRAAWRMAHTDIWNPDLALKGETPKSTQTFLFEDIAVKTGEA
jgi:hypothetical protein